MSAYSAELKRETKERLDSAEKAYLEASNWKFIRTEGDVYNRGWINKRFPKGLYTQDEAVALEKAADRAFDFACDLALSKVYE